MIRMRAEIRAGELLAEMKTRGERVTSKDTLKNGRGSSEQPREPKLSDIGVSKDAIVALAETGGAAEAKIIGLAQAPS
jgi:hypothetical protein